MGAEMNALLLEETAANYAGVRLGRVPRPAAGKDQALVRVRAASISFVDLLMTSGGYQYKPPLPHAMGTDFAGEIVESGGRFRAGAAVMGMHRSGAFAEYIVVDEDALTPKPGSFDWGQAAAFGQAYLTAFVALTRHGALQKDEWLLVHGASGGVGLAAVDLGGRMGARVIAASASQEKLAKIAELYRPAALLDTSTGFRGRVKEITGHGADVVYDPVGGDVFDESVRCTAFDGRYLIVGFASGRIPQIAANYPLIKGLRLIGVRAGEYGRRFPERGAEDREALRDIARRSAAQPHVHSRFPMTEWREAFAVMNRREHVGRVILEP